MLLVVVATAGASGSQLPTVTIQTTSGTVEPAFDGCPSWLIGGRAAVVDCIPYEYDPITSGPALLRPGSTVTFAISSPWAFTTWRVDAIAEHDITPGLEPPDGQRELARGSGHSTTIIIEPPASSGRWRLLLTYDAEHGADQLTLDMPAVFFVQFSLPDTSTATPTVAPGLELPTNLLPLVPIGAIAFLVIRRRARLG
jgi:hypothetical protein